MRSCRSLRPLSAALYPLSRRAPGPIPFTRQHVSRVCSAAQRRCSCSAAPCSTSHFAAPLRYSPHTPVHVRRLFIVRCRQSRIRPPALRHLQIRPCPRSVSPALLILVATPWAAANLHSSSSSCSAAHLKSSLPDGAELEIAQFHSIWFAARAATCLARHMQCKKFTALQKVYCIQQGSAGRPALRYNRPCDAHFAAPLFPPLPPASLSPRAGRCCCACSGFARTAALCIT